MVSIGIRHFKFDGDLGEETILVAPSKPCASIEDESKASCGKWSLGKSLRSSVCIGVRFVSIEPCATFK